MATLPYEGNHVCVCVAVTSLDALTHRPFFFEFNSGDTNFVSFKVGYKIAHRGQGRANFFFFFADDDHGRCKENSPFAGKWGVHVKVLRKWADHKMATAT